MGIQINPWVRCECGKIHVTTHAWTNSKCECGKKIENKH